MPTTDPDVQVFHLCRTFGCLPSQLDEEDVALMERIAYVDYVYESKVQADMKAATERSR